MTRFCDQAVFLHAGRIDQVLPAPEPALVARMLYDLGERAVAGRDSGAAGQPTAGQPTAGERP